jgi:hypothetical protein
MGLLPSVSGEPIQPRTLPANKKADDYLIRRRSFEPVIRPQALGERLSTDCPIDSWTNQITFRLRRELLRTKVLKIGTICDNNCKMSS